MGWPGICSLQTGSGALASPMPAGGSSTGVGRMREHRTPPQEPEPQPEQTPAEGGVSVMTEKTRNLRTLGCTTGRDRFSAADADKCGGGFSFAPRRTNTPGEYKTLFAAAKRLYQEGRPIDPVTVRGIAGEEYTNLILQIMELTPTAANCGAYLDLLVEQAQVSKMQTLGLALASCKSAEEAKAPH